MKIPTAFTTRSASLAGTASALAFSLVSLHLAMSRPVAPPVPQSIGEQATLATPAGQPPLDVVWRGRRRR